MVDIYPCGFDFVIMLNTVRYLVLEKSDSRSTGVKRGVLDIFISDACGESWIKQILVRDSVCPRFCTDVIRDYVLTPISITSRKISRRMRNVKNFGPRMVCLECQQGLNRADVFLLVNCTVIPSFHISITPEINPFTLPCLTSQLGRIHNEKKQQHKPCLGHNDFVCEMDVEQLILIASSA